MQGCKPYSVQVVTETSALRDLESDWNRLSESADQPNVFMTYDWFRVWGDRLAAEAGPGRIIPHVLVFKRDGLVVGIAPWIRQISWRRGIRLRSLEFPGDSADYTDFLLGEDTGPLLESLTDHLERTAAFWDVIDLRELRSIPGKAEGIQAVLEQANLTYRITEEALECPYLPLEADAGNLIQGLSGHRRRTLRREAARASAEGLRMRFIDNPAAEPGLMEKLIAVDAQRSVGKQSEPIIGPYAEAFQSLFTTLGPRSWLYVALAETSDRPVAFQLGFRSARKLWGYSMAFDESFARLAPGRMLMLFVLEHARSSGCEEFDFGRGAEQYKSLWARDSRRNLRMLIWNRRAWSRLGKLSYSNVIGEIRRFSGLGA